MPSEHQPETETPLKQSAGLLLIATIFVLAICGLVYELIAGALSSYLLGDSVTQFSIVIGLFLSAMGLGSFLSKHVRRHLLASLIEIETYVGLVGGTTALVGFATFALSDVYTPVLLTQVAAVGVLVGLEIPLVIRILRQLETLRVTLAHVLSADYSGALAASLLFPFLLLPYLGLARAGLLVGLVNVAVAGLLLWAFRSMLAVRMLRLRVAVLGSGLILLVAFAVCGPLVHWFENRMYQDEIILARDTPYQRIVITRWHDDIRLYLDGHLQFSSIDEYRYHESLVHPAMSLVPHHQRVLILGGGDGLAARELLKYPDVRLIDLVDLDPAVTELFSSRPLLTAINADSLNDPRVHVHNVDAMTFLEQTPNVYDVILMDLPDPSRAPIGKLYSRAFFGLAGRRLAPTGVLCTQSTSPFRSRPAFWCIVHTLAATCCDSVAGTTFNTYPYYVYIPTFGTWGFTLASKAAIQPTMAHITIPTRFLTTELLPGLFVLPPDMAEVDTAISTLDNPVVSKLYTSAYHKYLD